ncbi:MAG: M20/M25/M40 family metallo-hydrolase [Clostridia bacterium]|nr:M20/M25/M40 family metallo-hydrolase [Clostridia bacterium]
MRLSSEKNKENVKYMTDGITHIIKTFEKRPPGSKGERDAQNYMASDLEKYMDKVWTEDFELHPGAFMGWIYITVACLLLAFTSFWLSRLATLIFIVLAIIPMITQLILYKEVYDPLFKKETSVNVVSVKKPKGEVKRRVILNGHADATWEWTILYKFGFGAFKAVFLISIIGVFYFLGLAIAGLIVIDNPLFILLPANQTILILGAIGSIFVPFWIVLIWFSDEKTVVDGANDNLTGCYVPMAVAKTLKEEGIELQNTEFMVVLSGSEEAGLRGAKRFAVKHKEDLSDVETIIIPFETLREKEHLSIFERDLNMTVATDRQLLALIKQAGRNVGTELQVGMVELGSTDAAAFTQAGFKSVCIGAMDHDLQPYYHTRKDTYDNLDPETLGISLDIALETVLLYDKEGLPAPLPKGTK